MALRERCRTYNRHCRGFTLIELLITMVIFLVTMTAVYTSYLTQQKTYLAQTQVTAMQQNLRAGLYLLERELRMAGFDPNRTADAGFLEAKPGELSFTFDRNRNGKIIDSSNDPGERLHYALVDNTLKREVWGGNLQPAAENIEVLDLVYLDGSDPPQVLNTEPDRSVPSDKLDEIRSVQVTMVARTDQEDRDYTNTTVYRNQQGEVILPGQNDHIRRRILSSTVRCRNMGL